MAGTGRRGMVELAHMTLSISLLSGICERRGIDHMLLDDYVSAAEGSINAIPRRIVVAENMLKYAQKLLSNHSLTINQ
jgi:hypothetical protein